jgi:hypothetical protein
MTVGVAGLCSPWVTAAEVVACCAALDDVDIDVVDEAVMYASEILYVFSGRHWPGVGARSTRPCTDCGYRGGRLETLWLLAQGGYATLPGPGGWWWDPYGGYPPSPSCCSGACGRSSCDLSFIRLPGPVVSVDAVWVDGVRMPDGDLLLQPRNRLYRLDGAAWPCTNDLTRRADMPRPAGLDVDVPVAWQVDYTYGALPPSGGVSAAKKFACELALGFCGSDLCQLPWNVTSINRRGVTVEFSDDEGLFENGNTGLREVDLWLVAARGGKWRPRKAAVRRADQVRRKGFRY